MLHIYNVIAPSGIKTDKKYPLIYCQGQCLVHWRWIRQDNHYCLHGHGGFLRLSSLSKCMVLTGKRGRTRNYVLAFFSSSFPTTSLWKDTNLLFGFSQLQILLFFLSPLNHFNGQEASEKVCVSLSSRLLHNITLACFCLKESATLMGKYIYIYSRSSYCSFRGIVCWRKPREAASSAQTEYS